MTTTIGRDVHVARGRRRIAAPLIVALALSLVACAPALPDTVVAGTEITAGWTGVLTSTNAAATPTRGNLDIAETIRGDFGDVVDGEFAPDEGFGTITIVSEDPFTVRYDLAEPAWSDGIPLDAADLLLGWAAASGRLAAPESADAGSEDAEPDVPRIDEFARAIEVTFPQPVRNWQRAVTVPVPAHIVARLALGIDDAMEAKQAVITAIQEGDATALAALAKAWDEGFTLPEDGEIPADLLVSSGPFRIDAVADDEAGQSVTLVPNAAYRGPVTPQVAKIALVPPGADPIVAVGDTLDAVQVAPVAGNRDAITELERQDFAVTTAHDGTVWAVSLNPAGIFTQQPARAAFLRAVPARALIDGGAPTWASAYTASTSVLSAPGSRPYDIVSADSGFTEALGTPGDDAAVERQNAGIAAGAGVCVLYDRGSEFATGAFAALRVVASEAGWNAEDCGTDDLDTAIGLGGWDAVISRVRIPQTPQQIAAQWGSQGTASITGNADPERDALITQFAQTADVYEAREVLAQIEATIVRAAVVLPLAVNPTVTLIDKDVTGIAPRDGAAGSLTAGVSQWAVVP